MCCFGGRGRPELSGTCSLKLTLMALPLGMGVAMRLLESLLYSRLCLKPVLDPQEKAPNSRAEKSARGEGKFPHPSFVQSNVFKSVFLRSDSLQRGRQLRS